MQQDSFLHAANAEFVGELFCKYVESPSSVDQSWQDYFNTLTSEEASILKEVSGASWQPFVTKTKIIGAIDIEAEIAKHKAKKDLSSKEIDQALLDTIRARILIRTYRVRGHLLSKLDPLGIEGGNYHKDLDPLTYGFTESDFDRPIFIAQDLGLERPTLRELMDRLRTIFCRNIGLEYMHIQDPDERAWLQEQFETSLGRTTYKPDAKQKIFKYIARAELFEKFLNTKYTGTKRFGLDGGESAIPCVETMIETAAEHGVEEIVVGMPHRGRLNVLANIFEKPYRAIFSEFHGNLSKPDDASGSGDVKYHLGASTDRDIDGHQMHLSLLANPSHLEAVNPVVLGKVRAEQDQKNDVNRSKVLGILFHGDAAFAGQGVVAEGLMLSDLKGYRTGGTLHVIVNNQIGFTTKPAQARSGPYPSDVARMIQAPIFHVNGDDPEAVCFVSKIAAEYRQKFKNDAVIDLFCYRRHGHNEGDEPAFTQPEMYREIAKHESVKTLYAKQLLAENALTQAELDAMEAEYNDLFESEFEASDAYKPEKADWLEGNWAGQSESDGSNDAGDTAIDEKTLKAIGEKLTTYPADFHIHKKIDRQLKAKAKMFEIGTGFDWATAEAIAFGALVNEGARVRLSGQDCGRGTFSQRHAMLHDQTNETMYCPLKNISENQGAFDVLNSPLSEYAVMGFDYGYSLAGPNALVMWEGQFGDFVNGAQIMIDQFIVAAEAKWLRMSGLTLLLPHGYEGAGPEHSSGRVERFLQQCAENNIQVANCSTPANYYHILRRQVRRDFRKPLIIMTPKSLLRHKLCVSDMADFTTGSEFKRVIEEHDTGIKKVKRVVLCTGKIYYDLLQKREEAGVKDIALVRVEQLYPYPHDHVREVLKQYKGAEVIWCQEEPQNMGAWQFIDRRLESSMIAAGLNSRPIYVGRHAAASPATGNAKIHLSQQAHVVDQALNLTAIDDVYHNPML